MEKHEWRKQEKALYNPKAKPEIVDIPALNFITISGEGNPNGQMFASCIEALFSVSYAIKMGLKKEQIKPPGYLDYTVYPLEGVWSLNPKAIKDYDGTLNKDDLVFDIMIRQPDFITESYFHEKLKQAQLKKPNPMLERAKFQTIEDGKCIQMLHTGSFDDEPESFEKMEAFADQMNLQRSSKVHREIYLSDFRKVPTEKLKTILRFKIDN